MKPQTLFIVLCIAACATAVPSIRERRAVISAVDCGLGTPTGWTGLLTQVRNLLDNVFGNIAKIRLASFLGLGNLIDLSNSLDSLRAFLTTLVSGGSLSNINTLENRGTLSSVIKQTTVSIENLLGSGAGQIFACTSNGGILGSLLGNITDDSLGPTLKPFLSVVGIILRAFP